jgi:hypothetical protein
MAVPLLLNKNNSGEVYVWQTLSSCSDIIPPAVKRIMQEARELANDPSTEYSAAPLEVCTTYLSAYTRTNASSPTFVHNFRTISLYVFFPPRNVSLSPMWALGVALHPARAFWH